jgi:hypothetical protein
MLRFRFALASLALLALATGLVAILLGGGADVGHGISAPGTVDIVAIDAETSGNFPTFVADIDGCRDGLSPGQFVTIDVVVDEIDPADGIGAAGFDLVHNPELLRIESRAGGSEVLFYQGLPVGMYFDAFSEPLPASDGDYRHDAIEVGGTAESGEGVVARFVVQVVAAGVATIDLTDQTFFADGEPDILADGSVLDVTAGRRYASDRRIYLPGADTTATDGPADSLASTDAHASADADTYATPQWDSQRLSGGLPGADSNADANPNPAATFGHTRARYHLPAVLQRERAGGERSPLPDSQHCPCCDLSRERPGLPGAVDHSQY